MPSNPALRASETTPDVIESVAEAIYDAMREDHDGGTNKPWVAGGNSLKQDEARRRARRALGSVSAPRVPEETPLPDRCAFIAPEGHDFAGHQCGNYAGHRGAHTALVASHFTTHGESSMPQTGEFHWKNGVHFQRMDDGSVQLRIAPFGYDNMREIIPAGEWASIVAHVADGGSAEAYSAAEALHSAK